MASVQVNHFPERHSLKGNLPSPSDQGGMGVEVIDSASAQRQNKRYKGLARVTLIAAIVLGAIAVGMKTGSPLNGLITLCAAGFCVVTWDQQRAAEEWNAFISRSTTLDNPEYSSQEAHRIGYKQGSLQSLQRVVAMGGVAMLAFKYFIT